MKPDQAQIIKETDNGQFRDRTGGSIALDSIMEDTFFPPVDSSKMLQMHFTPAQRQFINKRLADHREGPGHSDVGGKLDLSCQVSDLVRTISSLAMSHEVASAPQEPLVALALMKHHIACLESIDNIERQEIGPSTLRAQREILIQDLENAKVSASSQELALAIADLRTQCILNDLIQTNELLKAIDVRERDDGTFAANPSLLGDVLGASIPSSTEVQVVPRAFGVLLVLDSKIVESLLPKDSYKSGFAGVLMNAEVFEGMDREYSGRIGLIVRNPRGESVSDSELAKTIDHEYQHIKFYLNFRKAEPLDGLEQFTAMAALTRRLRASGDFESFLSAHRELADRLASFIEQNAQDEIIAHLAGDWPIRIPLGKLGYERWFETFVVLDDALKRDGGVSSEHRGEVVSLYRSRLSVSLDKAASYQAAIELSLCRRTDPYAVVAFHHSADQAVDVQSLRAVLLKSPLNGDIAVIGDLVGRSEDELLTLSGKIAEVSYSFLQTPVRAEALGKPKGAVDFLSLDGALTYSSSCLDLYNLRSAIPNDPSYKRYFAERYMLLALAQKYGELSDGQIVTVGKLIVKDLPSPLAKLLTKSLAAIQKEKEGFLPSLIKKLKGDGRLSG